MRPSKLTGCNQVYACKETTFRYSVSKKPCLEVILDLEPDLSGRKAALFSMRLEWVALWLLT